MPALVRPLRGLQETRVATREESGVLGFPSRRGLTPRSLGFLLVLPGSPFTARAPHAQRSGPARAGVLKVKVQFSSVTQSCPTLCNPMDCSTPGFPVHHQLPEPAQTHIHRVGDAIQPSHPLSYPSHPLSYPSPLAFMLLASLPFTAICKASSECHS